MQTGIGPTIYGQVPVTRPFFGFGIGLGYIMVCDVTLVCIQVRIVILIKELAQGADRNRSPP